MFIVVLKVYYLTFPFLQMIFSKVWEEVYKKHFILRFWFKWKIITISLLESSISL